MRAGIGIYGKLCIFGCIVIYVDLMINKKDHLIEK